MTWAQNPSKIAATAGAPTVEKRTVGPARGQLTDPN